jgi:hypothetical protein
VVDAHLSYFLHTGRNDDAVEELDMEFDTLRDDEHALSLESCLVL